MDKHAMLERIVQLERMADKRFAEQFPAEDRLLTLDREERKEHDRLCKELGKFYTMADQIGETA